MFTTIPFSNNKIEAYQQLLSQAESLFADVNDNIATLSNASALLGDFLHDINWVGFYLWKQNQLILGPFQGKPACVFIASGKGVCGTAVVTRQTQRIANVHEFPGHIACDEASKSEIVIPIVVDGTLFGVLDIDAPIYNRFDEVDQTHLEQFVALLSTFLTKTTDAAN